MTIPRNFPGRKTERRIKALERLESELEYIGEIREDRDTIPEDKRFSDENIKRIQEEMKVLRERINKGGKRYTKKVHVDTGMRFPGQFSKQ